MKVTGVIFDMDGVLFDTERLYQRAWEEMAAERSLVLGDSFIKDVCGTSGAHMRQILSRYFQVEDSMPLVEECRRRVRTWLESEVPVKKGVPEILEYFHGKGIPMGVASSSAKNQILSNLEKSGLREYFAEVTSGSEVEHGKPAPDIFQLAAEKMGCDPKTCLVFEDSANGVRAGRAAGCFTIMVPDLLLPDEELKAVCSAVCADFLEVRQYLDEEMTQEV